MSRPFGAWIAREGLPITTVTVLVNLAIGLAPIGAKGGMAVLVATQFLGDLFGVTAMILMSSLRQVRVYADHLGRVSGVFQAGTGGMTVAGALGAARLAEATGIRTALLVAAVLSLVQPLLCAASPLARRSFPLEAETRRADQPASANGYSPISRSAGIRQAAWSLRTMARVSGR